MKVRQSYHSLICGLFLLFSVDCFAQWRPGSCSEKLTKSVLEDSLAKGTEFLLAHQQTEGNFSYEYHWLRGTYTAADNQVRQAGALWGLALIHSHRPQEKVARAFEKGLEFFVTNSRMLEESRRYVIYPSDPVGATGTVALVSLALIDFLRQAPKDYPDSKRLHLQGLLQEYLAFLVSLRRPDGHWNSRYSQSEGQGFGEPSPYFDGETLLALVKAALYFPALLPEDTQRSDLMESADAGYRRYVREARAIDPDSNLTKGYYQWGSMAFYELGESRWPNSRRYFSYVMELADWMIDTHQTLKRTRNTAYAYEGIIHAFKVAVIQQEAKKQQKYGCTIERGLEKLTSWQVGGPIPNDYISSHFRKARTQAIGGVQNHPKEDGLRIDVVQHQMHAVILALRLLYE